MVCGVPSSPHPPYKCYENLSSCSLFSTWVPCLCLHVTDNPCAGGGTSKCLWRQVNPEVKVFPNCLPVSHLYARGSGSTWGPLCSGPWCRDPSRPPSLLFLPLRDSWEEPANCGSGTSSCPQSFGAPLLSNRGQAWQGGDGVMTSIKRHLIRTSLPMNRLTSHTWPL